jgi:hypothetical protein
VDHWSFRPGDPPDAATRAEFDRLLDAALEAGGRVDYRLAAPKWQWLCHVADRGDLVLHGSNNPAIDRFEPRQSDDRAEFGNRTAVYAATDGIWPIYFAIVDRRDGPASLLNSCQRFEEPDGSLTEPHYFFSVNTGARLGPGTVYLLPAAGFEAEAPYGERGRPVHTAQVARLEPVVPRARLAVGPADFPVPIHRHDHAALLARIDADPGGFPWVTDR